MDIFRPNFQELNIPLYKLYGRFKFVNRKKIRSSIIFTYLDLQNISKPFKSNPCFSIILYNLK